ncbi:ExeM/NucH family extracellular endonuclease [Salinisphaera sp. LB1]|uniref:ExeM/NucH family extracellular endonuclease n=1 Tax=Salinisphaera sp. LB1 TaxID=2183911 RepID=UPI000FED62DA|nr:ExeM/NucH family extracellular endonuclease [Salinisphaera sp. LB1]
MAALSLSIPAAHAAGGVYFSEYVEGSGYNKALEIYNATGGPVDLSRYAVSIYFNGSANAGATIDLNGTLPAGKTYVLASSRAEAAILAVAGQTYGGSLFNGNDAISLTHAGSTDDVIGQIGENPGSAWGSGDVTTKNHTLRRDTSVTSGRTDGSGPFDPATQWTGEPEDTVGDLGQYTGSTGGDSGGSSSSVAFGSCGEHATLIHVIQGAGDTSPLVGQTRVVEAVVTDVSVEAGSLHGFYLQALDGNADADPDTSEGLFVYDRDVSAHIKRGDLVRVRGDVTEYKGETEFQNVNGLAICGTGRSVTPAQLRLPFIDTDAPEAYEGMAVSIAQKLTVTGDSGLGQYGELTLSAAGRLYTPTNVVPPGAPAKALAAFNARNRIVLDDGSSAQDPDPIIYPAPQLTAYHTVRDGDTITGIQGVLSYRFGEWLIEPTTQPVIDPVNPRPDASALPSGGNLRVASANIENYFNGNGEGGGFPTQRGADTYAEYQRQRAKTIAELSSLHADVIGLMEVENDGYGPDSAIQDIVNGLNAAAPAGTHYAFVDPGGNKLGTDAIANDIVYNTEAVTPVGAPATLLAPPFDYGNRPPLAQTFETNNHARFTYVANHLRSKGGCPSGNDPNAAQGDGQGCWNVQRAKAAQKTAAWLATDPTGSGDPDFILMGDFNSYTREDPIAAFKTSGYTSLLQARASAHAYTYTYKAEAGALDHALVNQSMLDQVLAVMPAHLNADEPKVLDYNTEYKSAGQLSSLYAPTPYRASDHDPLVVELDLTP